MKALTITQMILRATALLALVLGLIFWGNPALPYTNPALKGIHMLLGILVVLSLWAIGLIQGRLKGGSFGLAAGTFLFGLVVAIVGLWQEGWKASGANVELINIIHLLLGLGAIGFGEMIGGRIRRTVKAAVA
ncbi:MAG TPA: hypothetical protein VGD98_01815 [Ktedonobacteraceae bacterium]